MSEPRTYVVGIPLAITVHDDGRVEFDFDLAEISDCTENIEGDLTEQHEADVTVLSEAAGRIGNAFTTTIHPARPTA